MIAENFFTNSRNDFFPLENDKVKKFTSQLFEKVVNTDN